VFVCIITAVRNDSGDRVPIYCIGISEYACIAVCVCVWVENENKMFLACVFFPSKVISQGRAYLYIIVEFFFIVVNCNNFKHHIISCVYTFIAIHACIIYIVYIVYNVPWNTVRVWDFWVDACRYDNNKNNIKNRFFSSSKQHARTRRVVK